MDKKIGYVYQIIHNDGIAILKEEKTQTEYISFLDELTQSQIKTLRVNSCVSFYRSDEFEQFVAVEVEQTEMHYRKVV